MFCAAQSGGDDVRFVDCDDTTALDYEIDYWSSTRAKFWVKVSGAGVAVLCGGEHSG